MNLPIRMPRVRTACPIPSPCLHCHPLGCPNSRFSPRPSQTGNGQPMNYVAAAAAATSRSLCHAPMPPSNICVEPCSPIGWRHGRPVRAFPEWTWLTGCFGYPSASVEVDPQMLLGKLLDLLWLHVDPVCEELAQHAVRLLMLLLRPRVGVLHRVGAWSASVSTGRQS